MRQFLLEYGVNPEKEPFNTVLFHLQAAERKHDEAQAILSQRSEELRNLKTSIRSFVAEFEDLKWGYDGPCGSQNLVNALEYEATKNDNGH